MVGIAVMGVCGLAEAFLVYALIQFVREGRQTRRRQFAETISTERGRGRRGVLLADEMEHRVAASQEEPRLIRMGPIPMRAGSRGAR
jgi:hypothetical protein